MGRLMGRWTDWWGGEGLEGPRRRSVIVCSSSCPRDATISLIVTTCSRPNSSRTTTTSPAACWGRRGTGRGVVVVVVVARLFIAVRNFDQPCRSCTTKLSIVLTIDSRKEAGGRVVVVMLLRAGLVSCCTSPPTNIPKTCPSVRLSAFWDDVLASGGGGSSTS